MDGLELSLQVFKDLHSFPHFLVNHKLIGHLKWHQEASSVSFSLKIRQSGQHPVQNVLQCFFVAVYNFAAKIWIEISRVAKYF